MTRPLRPHRRIESTSRYVRFQAAHPTRRGHHPGVFALVNGLHSDGRLTPRQARYRHDGNEWFTAHLANPHAEGAPLYDPRIEPRARAWFKSSASAMIDRVGGYLSILDEHGIAWLRLDSDRPGLIVYDDVHQVIARPGGLLCRTT